jgi:outer membrane beta-barrel protein
MNSRFCKILIGMMCVSFSAFADLYDLPQPEIIMNRSYENKNQIGALFGYLPMGSFSKYVTFGASYTRKLNDLHSWEILNVQGASELKASLKSDLIQFYGLKDSDFPVLKVLGTTNWIYTPLYMKSLLFNARLVHSNLSFVLGGGMASFSTKMIPLVDAGMVLKFYLPSKNSIDLDFRYYHFFATEKTVRGNIMMSALYSFNVGGK